MCVCKCALVVLWSEVDKPKSANQHWTSHQRNPKCAAAWKSDSTCSSLHGNFFVLQPDLGDALGLLSANIFTYSLRSGCKTKKLGVRTRYMTFSSNPQSRSSFGVSPPQADKQQVSLVDTAQDRSGMTFHSNSLPKPQKTFITKALHCFSWIYFSPGNLHAHMVTAVMFGPELEQLKGPVLTDSSQMLPGNQVNLNMVAEILRDGVWNGDPRNRAFLFLDHSFLEIWKQEHQVQNDWQWNLGPLHHHRTAPGQTHLKDTMHCAGSIGTQLSSVGSHPGRAGDFCWATWTPSTTKTRWYLSKNLNRSQHCIKPDHFWSYEIYNMCELIWVEMVDVLESKWNLKPEILMSYPWVPHQSKLKSKLGFMRVCVC